MTNHCYAEPARLAVRLSLTAKMLWTYIRIFYIHEEILLSLRIDAFQHSLLTMSELILQFRE